jgi:hypothetical protein
MYSQRLLELFHNRRHAGRLEAATHYGEAGTPGQGPYTRLWLRVNDGAVEAASYQTYGCPAIIACMEALCREAVGQPWRLAGSAEYGERAESVDSVDSVERSARTWRPDGVSAERIADWVGGVPEGKDHCPALAAEAWKSLTTGGRDHGG